MNNLSIFLWHDPFFTHFAVAETAEQALVKLHEKFPQLLNHSFDMDTFEVIPLNEDTAYTDYTE